MLVPAKHVSKGVLHLHLAIERASLVEVSVERGTSLKKLGNRGVEVVLAVVDGLPLPVRAKSPTTAVLARYFLVHTVATKLSDITLDLSF